MKAEETAELLRTWALEAGFDRAGIAGLEPLAGGENFLRWLERGDQAEMGYLKRRIEERLEPEKVLQGGRSVLCVAQRYHPHPSPRGEEPAPGDGDLWPGVARYARGRDYHNLMGKCLKKLARRIREAFPGEETRVYVDTGPVLERELAARAGIGAVGKNTCLLARDGSWFFLGEVFLTLDLAPDEPLTDLCGRCTRCLEACPTGALPEPYRLDSNRCISYWTIEHRGVVPEEMRPGIGSWVFGCDICQEVCPWNLRSSAGRADPDFNLAPQRADLDLISLLALGEKEYRERFRGSAMQRARREGLQRNAAIAMGNRGDEKYVEPLAKALGSGAGANDPVVRGHAAWALGRIGGEAAERALREGLDGEEEPAVRNELREALKSLEGPRGGGQVHHHPKSR